MGQNEGRTSSKAKSICKKEASTFKKICAKEEGKGALKLAFEEADKVPSINLVLANDPDADRLAVAEREPGGHAWHVFTGNELGALLGHWAWCCWRKKNPPPADAAKVCMVGSAVSSKFLARMAAKEGFRFVDFALLKKMGL